MRAEGIIEGTRDKAVITEEASTAPQVLINAGTFLDWRFDEK